MLLQVVMDTQQGLGASLKSLNYRTSPLNLSRSTWGNNKTPVIYLKYNALLAIH